MKNDKVLLSIVLTQFADGKEDVAVVTPEVVSSEGTIAPETVSEESEEEEVPVKCAMAVTVDGPAGLIHRSLVKAFTEHDELMGIFRNAISEVMMTKMFGGGLSDLIDALGGKEESTEKTEE